MTTNDTGGRILSPGHVSAAPAGQRSKVPLLIGLLAATGLVADLQGVGMSPLVGVVTRELSLTTMEITWAMNSLLIGGALAVGLTSRLGDIGGHRRILIWLTLGGLVGSLMAAMAVNGLMLTIGRFLQGLAVATPLAWGLLRPLATSPQIQLGASILSLVICIFTPISLVLGGVFLEFGYSWKGVFWILSGTYVLMLVLALISPETPPEHRAKVKIDIVGALGLGAWLTAFLLALSITRAYGYTHPLTLTLFFGSIAIFLGWLVQQRRHSAPLMDFRNVDMHQMIGGYIGLLQTSVAAGGLYILLPAMLRSPVDTGYGLGVNLLWASMPLMCILPGAYISPMIVRKILPEKGPRNPMIVFGLITTASFLGCAFWMDQIWLAYLWVTVYGIGVCGCYSIAWTLVASSARSDNMGVVMAGLTVAQKVAGAIAVALIIMALDPARGHATLEVYQMCYIGIAIACLLGYVLLPVVSIPPRLRDRYALDAAAVAD